MNAKIKSAAVQHNSYTLTCPTRWIFKKFVEIVASSVTCSNWFSSFKISRVPHISWCAGLYIFFIFWFKLDGRKDRRDVGQFRNVEKGGGEKKKEHIRQIWKLEQQSTWFDAWSMCSNLLKVVLSGETHANWVLTTHENVINITRSTCLKQRRKRALRLMWI